MIGCFGKMLFYSLGSLRTIGLSLNVHFCSLKNQKKNVFFNNIKERGTRRKGKQRKNLLQRAKLL